MRFHPNKKQNVLVSHGGTPFALLSPKHLPDRTSLARLVNDLNFLATCTADTVTAIDFETRGNDPCAPDASVVGVGLANAYGSVYFTAEYYASVISALASQQTPLIAHNLFFDASWPARDYPSLYLAWLGCTYACYKFLATEGWAGQEWGLKAAQKDLLLWKETNEKELDNWLIANGYVSSTSLTEKPGYYISETLPDGTPSKWARPEKGEMWRAPQEILGKYCRLDAEATWLLYTHLFVPALRRFPALSEYLSQERYTKYILEHVRQKLDGILIDRERLASYQQETNQAISQAKEAFFAHESIQTGLAEYNAAQVEEVLSKEPTKYKKNGDISKNWLSWQEKVEIAKRTNHFNMNSGQQRQWLFYDYLGFPVRKTTESGQPAVDGDALLGFGEVGQLLIRQNDLVKEYGFIEQIMEGSAVTGKIHGSYRLPGTLTGRLAANSPNLQQMPKSAGLLECFVPRPGTVWVDCDHTALEQVVLAELSKDPALWKLYGPAAKKNDVYLFTGANLPVIGEAIRAAGYDPENPTPEGISSAKKNAKHARGIAKTVVLASSYGAGAKKIAQTLRLQGVEISDWEAEQIHRGYWELYAGVRVYQRFLEREYRDRGGWVLNGIGRPIGVFHDYEKDLVNRVCQSTGSDIHTLWCYHWMQLLSERNILWNGVVICWHDQSIIEVPIDRAEEVRHLMGVEAYARLNAELGGKIPLRGEANIVRNLAEAKVEGYQYGTK